MAQPMKKPKIEKDRFTEDGVRMFNPSLEHGVVYADGYVETKFIQAYQGREMHYRGDYTPVGYVPGQPLPPAIDEVEQENKALKDRIAQLEAGMARTQALLERLTAKPEEPPKAAEAPAPAAGKSPAVKPSEARADGERPRK